MSCDFGLARATALAIAIAAGPVHAGPSDILPSDQLRLRVMEWLPLEGEIKDWSAIADAYTVAADGTVTIPFVGTLPAAGRSTEALAQEISEALFQRFALPDLPATAVSLNARSPVMITGEIRAPGDVPFEAGMTARHAIARAGGVGFAGALGPRSPEERLEAETQLAILRDREDGLMLRAARLRAEISGADQLEPEAMRAGGRGETLRQQEEELLRLHRDQNAREIALIDGRRDLLSNEINALEAKVQSLAHRMELAADQKQAMESLAQRGLTVNARLFDAEQMLATLETQLLDTQTAILRAKQNLATAETDRLERVEGRSASLLVSLQETEQSLAETRNRRIAQQRSVMMMQASAGDWSKTLQVTIRRMTAGDVEILTDALDVGLLPGDLLEVTLRNPEDQG